MARPKGARDTNQYQKRGLPAHPQAQSPTPLLETTRRQHPGKLARPEIASLLAELADRLAANQIQAHIKLVGGAALAMQHYNRRGTVDIDAVLSPAGPILAVAAQIAAEHNLEPDWLNNKAQGFLPPGDLEETPDLVQQHNGVTIHAATARVLLAMKLRASRPAKDIDDIAVLIRACDIRSVDEANELLETFYHGEHELSARGRQLVQSVCGAYPLKTDDGTILLDPVQPRPPSSTCGRWVLREDRRCELPAGHQNQCA
jgi:hypothetical protein